MIKWLKYIDKTFVINLPERPDRLQSVIKELSLQGISFDIFEATKNEAGHLGCYESWYKILTKCKNEGYQNVMIFEDDIVFRYDLFKNGCDQIDLSGIIAYPFPDGLPFDILYLGYNAQVPLYNKHPLALSLLIANKVRSTCAMIISKRGIEKILEEINKPAYSYVNGIPYHNPIDVLIEQMIQPQGLCYCINPMLVTQANGYSDIEKKDVDMSYMEQRFIDNTKHLR